MIEKTEAHEGLHQALSRTLIAPPLPDDFRAVLRQRILRESVERLEIRRRELELEHAVALTRLHRNHVRVQRDTLALIVGVAFAAGACAHLALPWLQSMLGGDSAITLPLVAIAAGLAAGAGVIPSRLR